MDCRFCPGVKIKERKVIVGAPPGRVVSMYLSAEPDPAGEVVRRDDGKFRYLFEDQRTDPNKSLYRIHGRSTCAPARRGAQRARR